MKAINKYAQIIRNLSQRIVKAQQPIRVLDAIKWDNGVAEHFLQHKGKKLPLVDKSYYQNRPLKFNSKAKAQELQEIENDCRQLLGPFNAIGNIMVNICREYKEVLTMLESRGTPKFAAVAQRLYGSSQDVFYPNSPTLNDLANMTARNLGLLKPIFTKDLDEKKYSSSEAVDILHNNLKNHFIDSQYKVQVKLSDAIVADAAAGAECIKIRKGARFSARELKILEIHEGWVHLGTTLNGLHQPVCTFLSKGTPSATTTQEGLAVIMELFTFSSHPTRMQGLTDRIIAINMAEQGANFLQVFDFFQEKNNDIKESYIKAMRVFRGTDGIHGAFTKDLSYNKGFILIYNYLRLAIANGNLHIVPLLFLGKVALNDLKIYAELMDEKIITPPRFIPPQFTDLAALSSWMGYSLFLNQLDLKQLAKEYKGIL